MPGPIDVSNFLKNGAIGGGTISTVFGRTGDIVAVANDYSVGQIAGAAPINNATFTGTFSAPGVATLASPAFTGTPTAPTLAASDNTTKLATTAMVQSAITAAINALVASGVVFAVRESGGVYPARTTTGAGTTNTVMFIGVDADTIGAGNAQNDTDIWVPTSV